MILITFTPLPQPFLRSTPCSYQANPCPLFFFLFFLLTHQVHNVLHILVDVWLSSGGGINSIMKKISSSPSSSSFYPSPFPSSFSSPLFPPPLSSSPHVFSSWACSSPGSQILSLTLYHWVESLSLLHYFFCSCLFSWRRSYIKMNL